MSRYPVTALEKRRRLTDTKLTRYCGQCRTPLEGKNHRHCRTYQSEDPSAGQGYPSPHDIPLFMNEALMFYLMAGGMERRQLFLRRQWHPASYEDELVHRRRTLEVDREAVVTSRVIELGPLIRFGTVVARA